MKITPHNHADSWRCVVYKGNDAAYDILYLGDDGTPAPYLIYRGEVFVLTGCLMHQRNATYHALSSTLVWEVEEAS